MTESNRLLEQIYWNSLDCIAEVKNKVSEDTSHGSLAIKLCAAYMALGETQLLLREDVDAACGAYRSAGEELRAFLHRRTLEDPRFCCISLLEVVDVSFSVLAANDMGLMQKIIGIVDSHSFINRESPSIARFTWRLLVALIDQNDPTIRSLLPEFKLFVKREKFGIGIPDACEAIANRDESGLDIAFQRINTEYGVDRRRRETNYSYLYALPIVSYYNLAASLGMSPRIGFESDWIPKSILANKTTAAEPSDAPKSPISREFQS